jgi:asparagine synthase (glutamine-hydrolysing)
MCGIFGAVGAGADVLVDGALRASRALAHRGPDAEGTWRAQGVLLGHRRLSILDLASRADQPMRRGPLCIVYNGEIYNFASLRRDLETRGERFETTSDTEVLLAGLLRDGLHFLEKVEGMFAFALHDARDRSLLLARDRYGEKPLFIYEARGRVFFASEPSGIEALSSGMLDEDPTAIDLYFRLSYIPAPYAPFRDTSQLEPGTWRRYDAQLTRSEGRYYTLTAGPESHVQYDEALEAVRAKLSASISLRLTSADVPVATLLSGGLDSTIVTLLAAQLTTNSVAAYSLSFPDDPSFDEGRFAAEAAKSAPNIDHRIVPASVSDLLKFTDRLFTTLSEPFADASLVPTAYLMSHIEEKVVLGGDGADEIFAGYGSYAAMHLSAMLPKAIRKILQCVPAHRAPSRITSATARAFALFHANLADDPITEYMNWRSYAQPGDLLALGLTADIPDALRASVGNAASGALRDIQAVDISFNLPNDMLRKVDLAGMAFGVEARLPYLDKDLVHFALSMPDVFRIKGRVRKRMLRDAFASMVPQDILARRKMGFLMPIRKWFEGGPLRDALQDLGRAQSRLDRGAIDRLVSEHGKRQADHSELLWAIYVYLRWCEARRRRALVN